MRRRGGSSPILIDEETELAAVEICKRLAERNRSRIIAAAFYGSQVSGYAREDSDVDVLLILEPYRDGVLYHYVPYEPRMFSVLAVDGVLFEKDVKDAYLGEFVSGRLLTPYEPITSKEYLRDAEVAAKTRFAIESILGLISDYPRVWTEIMISPEFFILDKMWRRARIYPPVRYSYLKMLEGSIRDANLRRMGLSYEKALGSLAAAGLVTWDGRHYKVTPKAKQQLGSGRAKIIEVARTLKRAASAYAAHGYAGRGVTLLDVAQEFASKLTREIETGNHERALEDPENHLFLPSGLGPISLSERIPIERISERLGGFEGFGRKSVERLGSAAVNSVFLIRLSRDGEERRVVAKKYRDWHGFKWFPLALWTIGVQRFALRGRSRMANEYSALLNLRRHGFAAPDIVDLSWADSVLYTQYIDGQGFEELAKNAFSSSMALDDTARTLTAIGRTLADVHTTGIILGDPKPENIVLDDREQVFFLDLEQAVIDGGQPAWDLAELLYYTSHLTLNAKLAKGFAEAVLDGYLSKGSRQAVEDIASPRFMRVFAVVSAPHVLRAVSEVCKKAAGEGV